MLSEISPSEKSTANTIWFHLYVESKNKTNKSRLIEAETKGVVARGKGDGGCVKMVKGNIVNIIVISLHGDR